MEAFILSHLSCESPCTTAMIPNSPVFTESSSTLLAQKMFVGSQPVCLQTPAEPISHSSWFSSDSRTAHSESIRRFCLQGRSPSISSSRFVYIPASSSTNTKPGDVVFPAQQLIHNNLLTQAEVCTCSNYQMAHGPPRPARSANNSTVPGQAPWFAKSSAMARRNV